MPGILSNLLFSTSSLPVCGGTRRPDLQRLSIASGHYILYSSSAVMNERVENRDHGYAGRFPTKCLSINNAISPSLSRACAAKQAVVDRTKAIDGNLSYLETAIFL